jgi:hypothetical protein
MRRDIHFGLMLSRVEKRALHRLAERKGGLSQAAALRMLLRSAAHKEGLWPRGDLRKEAETR